MERGEGTVERRWTREEVGLECCGDWDSSDDGAGEEEHGGSAGSGGGEDGAWLAAQGEEVRRVGWDGMGEVLACLF